MGNVAGQAEGAGGTLPVPGDCFASDPAGADRVVPDVPDLHRGAAAPALPVAAVVLRPAGLPVEKNISFYYFFRIVPDVPALHRGAAAPALPEAAVVLRPAGLPVEKIIVFIIFLGPATFRKK